MNFYVGNRMQLSAPIERLTQLSKLFTSLRLGFALLESEGDLHTLAVLNSLDAFNPPTDPYVQGRLLTGDNFPTRWHPRHHHRPEVRTALEAEGLTALLEPPRIFMMWGRVQWQLPLPTVLPPNDFERSQHWSVLVGFSSSKKTILAQKKVQDGLRAAGFVTRNYENHRTVFGKCVGTLKPDEFIRELDFEADVPVIGAAMQAFLAGAGSKLTPPARSPEAVEAFLCTEPVT